MKPPTLEQWREWSKTAKRNLTDDRIGHSAARRSTDARNSEFVTPAPLNPASKPRGPREAPQRPQAASKSHLRNSVTPIREPQRKFKRLVERATQEPK